MASLIEQNGNYYAQFYSRLRRPSRKKVPIDASRRRDAERALQRMEGAVANGDFNPWLEEWDPVAGRGVNLDDITEPPYRLGEAVEAYLASCDHLKPSTQQTYSDIVRPFALHVGHSKLVGSLAPRDIRSWLDTTSTNAVSQRKYVKHLGYFIRYCMRQGIIEQDISKKVRLPKIAEQAPKALTIAEVGTMVETARAWPKYDYSWLADLVEANVEMGLRRGELRALRPAHISMDRGVLRVVNDGNFSTKSGKERTIPITPLVRQVLERRLRHTRDFVFESHKGQLSLSGLSHAFRRVRHRAELPDSLNLHSTRHTFATRLAERGVPVTVIQKLMGHSSVMVTERYMHVRADVAQRYMLEAFG